MTAETRHGPMGPRGPSETAERRAQPPKNEVWIRPTQGWISLGLDEFWQYRDVLWQLARRELIVRYKQTLIGFFWAILQPLLMMLVFTFVFGRLAKLPSDGLPYPIFSLAALIPWSFFSESLTRSADSTVGQANMIKKAYFPRLVLPVAPVLARMFDLCVSMTIMIPMMLYYEIVPTANVIFLPFFLLLAMATALGAGFWLSALNVQFRDVRMAVPFIVMVWMFITPIAYPSSMLDEPWRTVYALNPMAGVVEGFRWALLGTDTNPGAMIVVSTLGAAALLISGAYFYRRTERFFADIV